jgi:hypothetical protein
VFLAGRVVGLVADRLDAAVDAEPSVASMMASVASVSARLTGVAPIFSARASRSAWKSTTNVWAAPRIPALSAAIRPTGPAPKIATVRPGSTPASSVPW